MKTRQAVVVLVGALCLASCGPTSRSGRDQGNPPAEGITRTLGHPHDVVWSAIQEYMAVRKWPLAKANRESGLIRSGTFRLDGSRDYAHCRTGRRSTTSAYESEVEIWVRRLTANGTTVTVSSRVSALSDTGRNSDCSSTGSLEDELFAGIDSVIAARRQ